MQRTHRIFKIIAFTLTIGLMPFEAALAGFSISIDNGGYRQRSFQRALPHWQVAPYYTNRYGQRYLRESPVYFDRYGRRYLRQRHQARRYSNCDVIIVRPRYRRPYKVVQNCAQRPFATHRRNPNSVR